MEQGKFCHAREIITDDELKYLINRYHYRHPTFTIDIQERTCKTIIIACVYHYRHIEINLCCQCIYNEQIGRFHFNWLTDQFEYKDIVNEIFSRLSSLFIYRSIDDQIETIIEEITKYFTQVKPIIEQQSMKILDNNSTPIEILKYDRSPRSRRRQCLERSLSWSQPANKTSVNNFNRYNKQI